MSYKDTDACEQTSNPVPTMAGDGIAGTGAYGAYADATSACAPTPVSLRERLLQNITYHAKEIAKAQQALDIIAESPGFEQTHRRLQRLDARMY